MAIFRATMVEEAVEPVPMEHLHGPGLLRCRRPKRGETA